MCKQRKKIRRQVKIFKHKGKRVRFMVERTEYSNNVHRHTDQPNTMRQKIIIMFVHLTAASTAAVIDI